MSEDIEELGAKRVCFNCIGDSYLKAELLEVGDEATCDFCNVKEQPSILMSSLADRVETAFDQHFRRTPTGPSSLEYAMQKEGIRDWEREGQETVHAIADVAGVDTRIAEDVQTILADRHGDYEADQMGEETPFSGGAYYEEASTNDAEFHADWRMFEEGVQTRARFYNREADATLSRLFDGIAHLQTRQGIPVVREIGPGRPLTRVYRARVFQSDKKLAEALGAVERLIGSPATEAATAGRMNARGISVFYGASDEATALNEIRPPVGSRAVTAQFELLRTLRVLDVAAIRSVYVDGSYFDPAFAGHLERAKFLSTLAARISMPVMPDDEAVDYLVTQAMAEYLSERTEPPLDGILYPSAQGEEGADESVERFNLVLFNKAARVEILEIPTGSKTEVSLEQLTEDGWEEDYAITQVLPRATPVPEKEEPIVDLALLAQMGWRSRNSDLREVTLRLDRTTLKVQRVTGVKMSTRPSSIFQHSREDFDYNDPNGPF